MPKFTEYPIAHNLIGATVPIVQDGENKQAPSSLFGGGGGTAIYDVTIKAQAEFEDLIASSTWFNAKSVALVGQFTLNTPNNSGVKIPATVKQIHGYNGAKITITNFEYNATTAKGGLWYDAKPEGIDYSIRNLKVDCTGSSGAGYGFYNCTNLTNCTGTGSSSGAGRVGYGFYNCTNLTNCTGTGSGSNAYGFYNCTNLTNCAGTGSGSNAYGFCDCSYANGCKSGTTPSTTAIWGGTNTKIDENSCEMDV